MGIFLDCLEIFSDQCWTRNAEALLVWKEQCSPLWVGKVRSLFRMLAYFKDRQTWRIKGVLLHLMGFPNFSMDDLERMNDDTRWLSDMHICFALQWGLSLRLLETGSLAWPEDPAFRYFILATYRFQFGKFSRSVPSQIESHWMWICRYSHVFFVSFLII